MSRIQALVSLTIRRDESATRPHQDHTPKRVTATGPSTPTASATGVGAGAGAGASAGVGTGVAVKAGGDVGWGPTPGTGPQSSPQNTISAGGASPYLSTAINKLPSLV